ncbi:MAG: hypothetical protein WA130_06505 [Candidatus Methanoperedens sp.]
MDAGLAYGLFELLLVLVIIVLPIFISYFIFYHYGAGFFWIVLRLTGASDFPLAPIVMSVSMIAGTVLIGFAVVKILDKNFYSLIKTIRS